MAMAASRVPTAGTRYAPICITSRPTPRLNQSEAWSCQPNTRCDAGSGVSASLLLSSYAIRLLQCKGLAGGRGPGGAAVTRWKTREGERGHRTSFPARGLPRAS
jgi:hypothetical protein